MQFVAGVLACTIILDVVTCAIYLHAIIACNKLHM